MDVYNRLGTETTVFLYTSPFMMCREMMDCLPHYKIVAYVAWELCEHRNSILHSNESGKEILTLSRKLRPTYFSFRSDVLFRQNRYLFILPRQALLFKDTTLQQVYAAASSVRQHV
jgi:hypothetical protein